MTGHLTCISRSEKDATGITQANGNWTEPLSQEHIPAEMIGEAVIRSPSQETIP